MPAVVVALGADRCPAPRNLLCLVDDGDRRSRRPGVFDRKRVGERREQLVPWNPATGHDDRPAVGRPPDRGVSFTPSLSRRGSTCGKLGSSAARHPIDGEGVASSTSTPASASASASPSGTSLRPRPRSAREAPARARPYGSARARCPDRSSPPTRPTTPRSRAARRLPRPTRAHSPTAAPSAPLERLARSSTACDQPSSSAARPSPHVAARLVGALVDDHVVSARRCGRRHAQARGPRPDHDHLLGEAAGCSVPSPRVASRPVAG